MRQYIVKLPNLTNFRGLYENCRHHTELCLLSRVLLSNFIWLFCCTTLSGSRSPDKVEFHFITILIFPEILTDYLSKADSISLCSGGKRFSVAEFAD